MRREGPGGRAGLDDHPPEPGMGMNEAVRAERHQQVMLRRTGDREDKITACDRSFGNHEPGTLGEDKVPRDVAVAKPVAQGRVRPAQRRANEANAVEPMHGIAPAQAKARAYERLRRRGERLGCHRGTG